MATNLTIDEVTQNVTLVVSNERGPAGPAGATGATGPAGPNSVTSATTSDGTANLSLATATVSGTLTSNHIHGNLAGSIYMHVRAGEALSKGDPVYVSGSHGTGASMVPIVMRADASNAAKMPAIAIMDAAVASNGDGHAVINGTISDLDTSAYSVNGTLYVANGGGMTATKPANAQPVARVERSNLNNGGIVVKVNGLYSDVTIASSQVTDATNAATAGTIVKRNGGGSAAFGSVTANTFDGDANAAFVNLGGGSNFISVDNGSGTPIFNFISLATAAATRTYTLPNSTGTVILDSTLGAGVNGLTTITGAKSFSGQVQLTGQAATDDNSAMTRLMASYEVMLSGNEFRQVVLVTSQQTGTGASAGSSSVVGMTAGVATASASSASAYTFDNIIAHATSSGTVMPSNKEIDFFAHGVSLRVEANTNWVLRLNFGVGSGTRTPPAAGAAPATSRQWGVEFYYTGSAYVGRLYYYDTSVVYGSEFTVPGLSAANWSTMVYAIRMRQTSTGTLEIYINSPTASNGGNRLPTTPTSTLSATWTSTILAGRHINFEAASAAAAAPSSAARITCATMFCRFIQ